MNRAFDVHLRRVIPVPTGKEAQSVMRSRNRGAGRDPATIARLRRRFAVVGCTALVFAGAGVLAQHLGASALDRQTNPPPVIPANCAPSAALTSAVARDSRPAPKVTAPLKDLGIQPALMGRPEWLSLLALAKQAGVGIVNTGVSWSALEPTGAGRESPVLGTLHQFVDDVRAEGMAVRFQLYGFPSWARDHGSSSASWLAPTHTDELARWSAWVHRLVGSFGSEVKYYEVWNEENNPQFWPSGPNPTAYAGLLACSYASIKLADPHAVVISGGLSTNDIGYLQSLYLVLGRYPAAAQLNDFFDVLGAHPYSGGRSPAVNLPGYTTTDAWGRDDTNYLGFEQLHAVMASNGEGWKQIYIGEYGIPSTAQPPVGSAGFQRVSESTRATLVPLAFSLAKRSHEVLALSWYTFYPDAYDGADWAIVLPQDPSDAAPTSWLVTPTYTAFAQVPSGRVTNRGG